MWIDRSGIYVFVLFLISDVFWRNVPGHCRARRISLRDSRDAAGRLVHRGHLEKTAIVGAIRRLWQRIGFLLKALAPFLSLSPSLALHAFALGGIGMITAGMMARISLGHTGRDIQQHSRLLAPAFMSLSAAYVARVLMPMIAPEYYLLWLGIAQAAWMAAFALLIWVYAPILVRRRIDGLPG